MIPILLAFIPRPAFAWGDEGHEIVAAIAMKFMEPEQRQRLIQLLSQDDDTLTAHDPVSVATWADRYRDSAQEGPHVHYHQTHAWHFVDLERDHPNLDRACADHPPLPQGTPASAGPARDCVVDKIEQFNAELQHYKTAGFPSKNRAEAILAVKYLIHFIGDLHQPMHAIDDHDRGGNELKVKWPPVHAGSLHHYWDTVFVERLGTDVTLVASTLAARITPENLQAWQQGSARDWARESFDTARSVAYDPLPTPNEAGHYLLSDTYVDQATEVVAVQLEEAGVRLAYCLDKDL
ncbi:MAG: S1/P1 Nuclease [Ferrovum sp.]|nr:S1/P1 Nuclease [Ferrovum sp.]NDU87823.1 S1/P1 Nuclease [Ferrovum sp.]